MIVYKTWKESEGKLLNYRVKYYCEGWFLFGFIPLYVRKVKA